MNPVPLILVAEDEAILRSKSENLLAEAGYQVLTARDGRDCLEQYRRAGPNNVSLVILDYSMPVLDGAETFRAIRAINPEARVLIHSASVDPETLSELSAAGAIGAIPKPSTPETFLGIVRAALPPA